MEITKTQHDYFTPDDPDSWDLSTSYRLSKSFIAGETLADMADADERIVTLTADLKYSNRTAEFERRHPDRFYNTGICEQNMVTMAAGMATFGLIPYVSTFASFVGLLCAEQIRTDLAYPNLPVRVIAHHAGISLGFYGTSHHATEDISITRAIAGLTVVCPCDASSLDRALRDTLDLPGPVYFRIGRGRDEPVYRDGDGFEVGKASVLREGSDLVIAANGATVAPSLRAAEALREDGLSVAVLDIHTIRPFDGETLCRIVSPVKRLLVVEEHNVIGGVATACADALIGGGVSGVQMERLGIPDEYSLIGPPLQLYRHYGLDDVGIANRARAVFTG